MSELLQSEFSRQDRLERLFDQLVGVDNIELTEEAVIKKFLSELCDIYSDDNFRHSYASISRILEEKYKPDQRDTLYSNIRALQVEYQRGIENSLDDEQKKQSINSKLLKLCDHVDLECMRLGRIDKVEHIGITAHNDLTAADGKLRETENKANEMEKRIIGFQSQNITILGIFAGLVITFSAVIQFSSSGLEKLTEISAVKVTFFVCLSFYFLFNIVFLLLFSISKISGTSIASNCRNRECEYCRSCKTFFGKFKRKYPFAFWFNFFGVILCIALCVILCRT